MLQAFFPLARLRPSNPDPNQSNGQHAQTRNSRNFEHLHETKDLAALNGLHPESGTAGKEGMKKLTTPNASKVTLGNL